LLLLRPVETQDALAHAQTGPLVPLPPPTYACITAAAEARWSGGGGGCGHVKQPAAK
jgi:hypothetical protein